MEGEHKGSLNGVEKEKVVAKAGSVSVSAFDLVMRLLGLTLTLAAAVIIGVDKQTKVVPITFIDSLPPIHLPLTAKWYHMSAFLYFLVTNAIACTYAALTLALGLVNKGKGKCKRLSIFIVFLDGVMVALLFSGIGATAAVGVLGYKGNSYVQWKKVCNVFDKFCYQVGASLVVSLIGSLAFLLLLLLPLVRLQRTT
ncbi:hypothetical protein Fmac_013522 [Flemingia macrophylla]|uniref:CASP-like protein n=1 Tax=Flemingia macrophylla TaxID=520843 RepID=A0ABD1MTV9_9FABA